MMRTILIGLGFVMAKEDVWIEMLLKLRGNVMLWCGMPIKRRESYLIYISRTSFFVYATILKHMVMCSYAR